MKKILFVGRGSLFLSGDKSILRRRDFEVKVVEDIVSFPSFAIKEKLDLLIVFDTFGKVCETILNTLFERYPNIPYPSILITDEIYDLPPFVRKVLSKNCTIDDFNDSVANFLNLPTRKSVRIPIRIGISVSDSRSSTIANTVNISGSGMLVEVIKPLTVGRIYETKFIGVPTSSSLPPLKVKVLREEQPKAYAPSLKIYALCFVGLETDKVEEILKNVIA